LSYNAFAKFCFSFITEEVLFSCTQYRNWWGFSRRFVRNSRLSWPVRRRPQTSHLTAITRRVNRRCMGPAVI